MTADIFFGVIHYQRLRHMVSDKFQVRISSKCQIDKIRAKLFDKNGGRKGGREDITIAPQICRNRKENRSKKQQTVTVLPTHPLIFLDLPPVLFATYHI